MLEVLILMSGALYAGMRAYKESKKKNRPLPLRAVQNLEEHKHVIVSTMDQAEPRLALAATSVGLATVGSLIYPPVNLVCLPALLYLSIPGLQNSYRSVAQEGRISSAVPESVIALTCLANGYYLALSLGFWLTGFSQKLVRATEADARQSLSHVFGEQPTSTWLLQEGIEIEMPFAALKMDDIVVVEAGNVIPVDGNIAEGSALIDQRRLTREIRPVAKGVGDQVFASSLVLAGRIAVKVEKAGEQTLAAQLVFMLNRAAAAHRATVHAAEQPLADQMALPMLGLGALAAVTLSPLSAIALLNSRLGYDADVLMTIGALSFLNVAAQNGILIKDGRFINALNQVDTIVLDRPTSLRPETSAIIRGLRRRAIDFVYVLTDEEKTLSRRQLGDLDADRAFAATSPEDKVAAIVSLQAEGKCVCYIGDGVCDAAVIRQANVAVSVRGLTTIGENCAQVVLMDASLNRLGHLFDLAKEFEANTASTFKITFAPGALNLTGTILFQSGLVTSILLNNFGLMAGMGNAVMPILDYELEKLKQLLNMLSGFASFGAKQDNEQTETTPPPAYGQVQLQMG